MTALRAPKGLGADGRALWRLVTHGLGFDRQERAHLEAACRLQDRVAELDALVAAEGTMVAGSRGQRVLHPAIAEARSTRAEIARLLSKIDWPTEASRASTAGRQLRAARKVG